MYLKTSSASKLEFDSTFADHNRKYLCYGAPLEKKEAGRLVQQHKIDPRTSTFTKKG